jgi:hypothetical protein
MNTEFHPQGIIRQIKTHKFIVNIIRCFGRSRVPFPIRSLNYFNSPNPSSHTMALGFTQPLTEMSTRYLPGGKALPASKADNLTVICEPII